MIPELYAHRGASVLDPKGPRNDGAEPVAQGLLGDLLGHESRALRARTGLALERGTLGTWLVGEAGALLVMPGGRRVHCFCVRVTDRDLPPSDRVAHLLLALREDEVGFATVANHAFAGAPWRVGRRLPAAMRPALDQARRMTSARSRLAGCFRASLAGRGIRGCDRRRRIRRALRGAPPGAQVAAPQRADRPRHRRELHALHAAAARRGLGVARAAPRGGAAPRGARVDRHPARQGHRRGSRPERALAANRRRARRDAALRPAGRGARLRAARAARAGAG